MLALEWAVWRIKRTQNTNNVFIQVVPDSCCFQDDATPSSPIDVNMCNSDVINGTIANSEYVFEEVSNNATTVLSRAGTNTPSDEYDSYREYRVANTNMYSRIQ